MAHSIAYKAGHNWNLLPLQIREADNQSYKSRIKDYVRIWTDYLWSGLNTGKIQIIP